MDTRRPTILARPRGEDRLKHVAQRVEQWTELDDNYAAGEFRLQLHGWSVERQFVVIGERVREDRDSVGRKLIDVPD